MKTYREVQTLSKHTVSMICDRCSTEFKIGDDPAEQWPDMGEIYCYQDDHRVVEFHICKPCYFSWLVPLFAREGIAPATQVKLNPSGSVADAD